MKIEKIFTLLVGLAFLALPGGLAAQTSSGAYNQSSQTGQMSQQATTASGTIQKLDKKANTIEIKGTASQMKQFQDGQTVQLMDAPEMNAEGMPGNVVHVSGDKITVKTADLSKCYTGQQIWLSSQPSPANAEGLGSGQQNQ